jgi:hypothetical protein
MNTKFKVQFWGSEEWISITSHGDADTPESVARHALQVAGGRDPGVLSSSVIRKPTGIGTMDEVRLYSTRRKMACSPVVLVRPS